MPPNPRPISEMMAEVKAIITLVTVTVAYVALPITARSDDRNLAIWYHLLAINTQYEGKAPQNLRAEGHPYTPHPLAARGSPAMDTYYHRNSLVGCIKWFAHCLGLEWPTTAGTGQSNNRLVFMNLLRTNPPTRLRTDNPFIVYKRAQYEEYMSDRALKRQYNAVVHVVTDGNGHTIPPPVDIPLPAPVASLDPNQQWLMDIAGTFRVHTIVVTNGIRRKGPAIAADHWLFTGAGPTDLAIAPNAAPLVAPAAGPVSAQPAPVALPLPSAGPSNSVSSRATTSRITLSPKRAALSSPVSSPQPKRKKQKSSNFLDRLRAARDE